MQLDYKAYNKTKDFNDEYGVTECVFEDSGPEYNSNRRIILIWYKKVTVNFATKKYNENRKVRFIWDKEAIQQNIARMQ